MNRDQYNNIDLTLGMKRVVLKVARGHSLPFKSVKFSGGFGKCFSFTKQVKIWAEVSETTSKVRGDNRILFLWWFIRWPQILFSFFHTYKCSKRTKTWGGGRVGGKWGDEEMCRLATRWLQVMSATKSIYIPRHCRSTTPSEKDYYGPTPPLTLLLH